MKKSNLSKDNLRREAEEKLSKQKKAKTPTTEADTSRLVHELQVHQIELEMQNEELIQARAEAEAINRQFTDLYDFAPVGYFTLARDGAISRVNLIGANLLGVERAKLVNRRLGLFVSAESRPAFNGFLEQVFISGVNETCEIALLKNEINPLWVRIEATCIEDRQVCRAVMVDISERKRVEDALRDAGQQWKSTFDATSDAICLLDNEQRILRANRAMTELFGKNFPEIIGKYCWEVAHGTQRPLPNCPIARMKNSRKRENIELALGAATFDVTVDPVFDENNKLIGAVHILRDITQRKQIEDQLLVTQRLSQSTIDALSAHLCVLDENGVILFVNRAWREFADANSIVQGNYFIGANYLNVCDNASGKYSEESAAFAQGIRNVIRGDAREFILEYPCNSPDEVRWFIGRVTRFHGGSSSNLIVIAHENITERKWTEDSLRQAEEKYRSIFENAIEGIYQSTPEGRFITVNPALSHMWGYASPQELIASITDIARQIYVDPDRRAAMWRTLEEQGEVRQVESQTHKKDGSTMWVSENMRAVRDANGAFICEGTFEDITTRKQAEEALRQSQELYQMLFEQSADAVFLLDLEGRHIQANQRAVEMLGYTRDEILKLSVREISAQTDESQNALSRLIKGEIIPPYERLFRKKNGDLINVEPHINLICDLEGHPYRVQSIVRDITERKQAEEKILHVNRLYATISQINQTIVRAQNLETLFPEICRVAIEHGEFRMAWIGLIDVSDGRIKPIAFAGEEQGYLSNVSIIVSDPKLGGGPTGTAIREERCIICQDIANDPRMIPWREQALQRGYRSSASAPIFQKNRPIGVLTVYASEPQGFNDDDRNLLDEIGQDISYAVDSLNTESERKQAEEKLHSAREFLRSVQDSLSSHLAILDENGVIVQVNSRWREFGETNGLKSMDSCLGMNYLHVCDSANGPYADEAARVAQAIRAVLAKEKIEERIEYPCHSATEKRWFVLHITKFEDTEQSFVVLAHENITERKLAEEASRQYSEQLSAAVEIEHSLATSLDRELIYASLMKGIQRLFPDVATIFISNFDSEREMIQALRGLQDGELVDVSQLPEIHLAPEGQGTQSRVIRSRQPLIINSDLKKASQNTTFVKVPGVDDGRETQSAIYVPMLAQDKILGLIQCQSYVTDRFTEEDVRTLSLIANTAAVSIQNALLFEMSQTEIRERKQTETEQQALLDIMQGLAFSNDVGEFLPLVHSSLGRVVKAENFFISLYDSSSGLFEGIYTVDQYDPPMPPSKQEKTLTSYIFRTKAPFLSTKERFEQLVASGEVELVGTDSLSFLGVPLIASGQVIGVMAVQDYHKANVYSERDTRFMMSIAGQVALAVQRKLAEETLRASEAQYRLLAEHMNDVIWLMDIKENKFVYVSPSVYKLRGYTPEEVMSQPVSESLTPESGELIQQTLMQAFQFVQEGKEIPTIPLQIEQTCKDGTTVWTEAIANFIFDESGFPAQVIGLSRDITGRKQAENALRESEEKFRTLIEQSADGIILIDEQGAIIGWNTAEERITGIPQARTLGAPFWEIQYQVLTLERRAIITPEYLKEIFIESISPGIDDQLGKPQDVEIVSLSGERKFIQQTSFLIKTEKGNRMAAIVRDITERVRAEDEIKKQLDELQRWHNATLGREMRVLELKREVNELLGKAGQPPRYPSAESQDEK